MKPVACILTFLMLFAMAQPLVIQCQVQRVKPVAVTGCCGGQSCHKKEKNKKTENKDCDRANTCNPFAGCSQCQYIAASKFLYASSFIPLDKKQLIPVRNDILPGYISDCFQPPEFVFA